MSLEKKIMDEMKAAMKSKDQAALRALRAIKSAILLEKTSGGGSEGLSEDQEMKLLMKQAKQRKDSAAQYRENGRDDLAQTEEEELAIIERFLPQALSPEDLEAEVKAIVESTGASSMKDMGRVMGAANKALAGRADGSAIAAIVKKILAGG